MSLPPWFQRPEDTSAKPESPDATRIHMAAHDPAFPQKRDVALAWLNVAITALAQDAGFEAKRQSWAKRGAYGTASLRLQRDPYGWDCGLEVSLLPHDGEPTGQWADGPLDAAVLGANARIAWLDAADHPERRETFLDGVKRLLVWLGASADSAEERRLTAL